MAQEWVELITPPEGLLTAKRQRCSKSYRLHEGGLPTNRFLCEATIGPMHYEDAQSDFQDIQTDLVPSSQSITGFGNPAFEMVENEYEMFVLGELNSGVSLVRYVSKNTEYWVQFAAHNLQWTNDLDQIESIATPVSTPTEASGNGAKWPDAYGPGIDLRFIAGLGRMYKWLDIASPLPDPPQYIIDGGNPTLEFAEILSFHPDLEVWVNGEEWDKNTEVGATTEIEFRSPDGEVQFVFPVAVGYQELPQDIEDLAAALPPVEDCIGCLLCCGSCESLVDGLCSIYETRPIECQDFQKDGPECLLIRRAAIERTTGQLHFKKTGNKLYVTARFPWSWLETAAYPVHLDITVDKQVAASGDDGYENEQWGFSVTSLSYPEVGCETSKGQSKYCNVFARWDGVTFGGDVDVSRIECWGMFAEAGSPLLKVYAVDEDDPAAPTSAAEFQADPLTAGVDWDVLWTANQWNQSPSLNSIFQAIADSYSPSNEAVMIQIKDDSGGQCTVADHKNMIGFWDNAGNDKGAKLYVEYTIEAAYYHGLSVSGEGELALCDVGNHPLRIRKGGTTYAIELVATDDPNASRIRIKTPAGIKAIRKYT